MSKIEFIKEDRNIITFIESMMKICDRYIDDVGNIYFVFNMISTYPDVGVIWDDFILFKIDEVNRKFHIDKHNIEWLMVYHKIEVSEGCDFLYSIIKLFMERNHILKGVCMNDLQSDIGSIIKIDVN